MASDWESQVREAKEKKQWFSVVLMYARALERDSKDATILGFLEAWDQYVREWPLTPVPSPFRNVFTWLKKGDEYREISNLPHVGKLSAILLAPFARSSNPDPASATQFTPLDPTLVLLACEILFIVDGGDKRRKVVVDDFVRHQGVTYLCRLAADADPEWKRADELHMFYDHVFRALSGVFLTGIRALRALADVHDDALVASTLQRAAQLYANGQVVSVVREGAGLMLQNLAAIGMVAQDRIQVVLDGVLSGPTKNCVAWRASAPKTLMNAILYWMRPSDAKMYDAPTAIQAAQLACNVCNFRAKAFVELGLLEQAFSVLVHSHDNPTLLDIVLNVMTCCLQQSPDLARVLARAGSPRAQRDPLYFVCPPLLHHDKNKDDKDDKDGAPTSPRALVWILALSHMKCPDHQSIVDKAMMLLHLLVTHAGDDLQSEVIKRSTSEAPEDALAPTRPHKVAFRVVPELQRQVLLVVLLCGWNDQLHHVPIGVVGPPTAPQERISVGTGVSYFQKTAKDARVCSNPSCGKNEVHVRLKACSRCKKCQYCSVECQRVHWKEHKAACVCG